MTAPRVTDAQIVETFGEIEAEQGGPQKANQSAVLDETAKRLGVTRDRARSAMLSEWGALG